MAAPLGKSFPVGMKHVRVYALESHGLPAATSTTVYEGLQIEGAQAFNLEIPDSRRITHTGDDRVLAQDILPRQEPTSGTLTTAINPHAVYAVMSSTKQATVGEASVIGYATSQQGSEPVLSMLCYQQAKEYGTGLRTWRSYMIPSTQAVIRPNSMTADKQEFTYDLIPSAVNHHLWGLGFAAGVEGFTEAEIVETQTFNIPHVVSWLGDNTETEFDFAAARQAVSTAKINAIILVDAATGVAADIRAASIGASTTAKVVPTPKPDVGDLLLCFYEYAA